MEDITDIEYGLIQRICKNLKITNLSEYHDLCVKSNTLLLAGVFKNIWNMS